jgi:aspartate/methionine/tyrosine aminotransferase
MPCPGVNTGAASRAAIKGGRPTVSASSAAASRPAGCALASYAAISDEPDTQLAERLTREIGVASIPVSVFYDRPQQNRVLRFCFAKNDDTRAPASGWRGPSRPR